MLFNTCEISPRFGTQWRNLIAFPPQYHVSELSISFKKSKYHRYYVWNADIAIRSRYFRQMSMSSEAKLRRGIGDISGSQHTTFGELCLRSVNFAQHGSIIYSLNNRIWLLHIVTKVPHRCCYLILPVHRELNRDCMEASQIKQYCLCDSLSSLASAEGKSRTHDIAIISYQFLVKRSFSYSRFTHAWWRRNDILEYLLPHRFERYQ